MPTYSYQCRKCGEEFDVFHGMSESPKVKCTACGSVRCDRLIGTGAGVIFKGSGFYETDYKNKRGKAHGDGAHKAEGGDHKAPESGAAETKTAKADAPKKDTAKHEASKPAKTSKPKD